MPTKSGNQRIAAAIALHSPEKLYKRNGNLLSMEKSELAEFSKGPTKKRGLKHALKRSKGS